MIGTIRDDEIAAARAVAEESPRAPVELRAGEVARQGDIVLAHARHDWTGVDASLGAPVLLGRGAHGAHVLLPHGACAVVEPLDARAEGAVVLARGGAVVHTDAPSGRHAAVSLPAGRVEWWRQRELDIETSVPAPVRD